MYDHHSTSPRQNPDNWKSINTASVVRLVNESKVSEVHVHKPNFHCD